MKAVTIKGKAPPISLKTRLERGNVLMSTKRKPPTLQQKKDEVNKKALIWSISIVAALVIVTAVLLIVT
ncbi:hypothetical protein HMSSN139_66990 [Paenibacillus sp. HMSSN-139]|jgi:hypothetical protein|nr:hypothetical protein HMSSN139_66990 [Paenibacillus sp. HMSSN-139]